MFCLRRTVLASQMHRIVTTDTAREKRPVHLQDTLPRRSAAMSVCLGRSWGVSCVVGNSARRKGWTEGAIWTAKAFEPNSAFGSDRAALMLSSVAQAGVLAHLTTSIAHYDRVGGRW